MSGFQIVTSKSRKITHNNRPHFPGFDQLYQSIHSGTVHRCSAVAVIYDFQKTIHGEPVAAQILFDACTLRLNAAAFIYAAVFDIAVFF